MPSGSGVDLLGLNRPEYAGAGEAVLSGLGWSLIESADSYDPIVYEVAQKGVSRRRFKAMQTRPNAIGKVVPELLRHGISFPDADGLEDALLDVFRGVIPPKAMSYPALPLVSSSVFLQDTRGMKGKQNPANYAQIIERFYSLGSERPCRGDEAARLWFNVLGAAETTPLFNCLRDLAAQMGPLRDGVVTPLTIREPMEGDGLASPQWLLPLNTPFHWFRGVWDSFCVPEWREALPRRRWCDWASCILRTALGMCYLWEAQFYRDLCEHLASYPSSVGEFTIPPNRELLKWSGRDAAVSTRDVSGKIRQTVSTGHLARAAVMAMFDAAPDDSRPNPATSSLFDIIAFLKGKIAETAVNPFSSIVSEGRRNGGPNTWETVVYLLQCRAETGADADFYSLLARRSRRFLVVEPGPEWIVVVASMAAGRPGMQTTLGQVRKQLAMLGLNPPRETLVKELEQAGLAGGSHDADDALEVVSAF